MRVENWSEFYAALKRKNGLDLNLYKQEQLQRRILTMLEQRGFKKLEELGKLIQEDPKELENFLDKLAINVSELFRNPEKWVELEKQVIPDLLKRSPKLKCWSAGCSFGAEAHTLAMILDNKFKNSHTVLGSDIDIAALNQAGRGEFIENDMRGVPKEYREKYFDKDGTQYRAKPILKGYLSFKRSNLLADRMDTGYDLIMCRNVVIYFTDPAKEELYRRFYDALKPGGVLFVGSTERIFSSKDIGFESSIPFFYRKPLEGERQWRNAS